jgi:hypothetical protein
VKLPPIEARYEWTRRQPLLAALLFGVIIIGPMIVVVFLLVRDRVVSHNREHGDVGSGRSHHVGDDSAVAAVAGPTYASVT